MDDIIPRKSLAPDPELLAGWIGACISNKDEDGGTSKKLCMELDADTGMEGGAECDPPPKISRSGV